MLQTTTRLGLLFFRHAESTVPGHTPAMAGKKLPSPAPGIEFFRHVIGFSMRFCQETMGFCQENIGNHRRTIGKNTEIVISMDFQVTQMVMSWDLSKKHGGIIGIY